MADWLQQRALANQQIERGELGLEDARRQDSDEAERRKIIRDATMEPVRDADTNSVTGYKQRDLSPDEQMNLYEKLGQHAVKSGKMTPDKALVFKQQMQDAEEEGMFDAYQAYRRSGDIHDATRMFNKRGKVKIDPETIMPSERKDPLTGQPYTAYVGRAENGDIMTFDPLRAAAESGGRKGWLDSQKTTIEGRKASAAERRNQILEEGIAARERVGMAAVDQRADAADDRAAGGGRQSVYEQKRTAYLTLNPGDERGALDYASGRKQLSGREARLASERMAAGMRDPVTNQPLGGAARRAAANQIYGSIMAENPAGTPPPAADPANPGPARTRPSLNQFLR